ncbi:hypothetical protein Tco_1227611 [Tanacetum coccineum]
MQEAVTLHPIESMHRIEKSLLLQINNSLIQSMKNEENYKEQSKRNLQNLSKNQKDGADDDQRTSAGPDWGSKRRGQERNPATSSAPSETTPDTDCRKTTTTNLRLTRALAKSAPVEGSLCNLQMLLSTCTPEFVTEVMDESSRRRGPNIFQTGFNNLHDYLPSLDHQNKSVPSRS